MHGLLDYNILMGDTVRHLTITPVNEVLPSGDLYSTGVYKIHEGEVGMGQINFDEITGDWHYDGYGDITHEQILDLVAFIKKHRNDNIE